MNDSLAYGLPVRTTVSYHPGDNPLVALYSRYIPLAPGWYVCRQGGCLVDVAGPFETEDEATAAAALPRRRTGSPS